MILIFLWDKEIKDYVYYKANLDNLPFDTMFHAMLRFQQEEQKEIKDLEVMKEDENYERILLKNYSEESIRIVTRYINDGELLMGEDIFYNVVNIIDISKGEKEDIIYTVDDDTVIDIMSLLVYSFYTDIDYVKLDLERKWIVYNKKHISQTRYAAHRYIIYNLITSYILYYYNITILLHRHTNYSILYKKMGFNTNIELRVIQYYRKSELINLFHKALPIKIYEFVYDEYIIIYSIYRDKRVIYVILDEKQNLNILRELEIPSIFKAGILPEPIDFLYCMTRGVIIHDYNVSNVSDLYYLLMLDLEKDNPDIIEYVGVEKEVKREIKHETYDEWFHNTLSYRKDSIKVS